MFGDGSPQSLSLGQLGSDFISDTNLHDGAWGVLQCVSACTFTTLSSGYGPSGQLVVNGTLNGISLVAGQTLFGFFVALRLASGSVMAYRCRASGRATTAEYSGPTGGDQVMGEGGNLLSGEGGEQVGGE